MKKHRYFDYRNAMRSVCLSVMASILALEQSVSVDCFVRACITECRKKLLRVQYDDVYVRRFAEELWHRYDVY